MQNDSERKLYLQSQSPNNYLLLLVVLAGRSLLLFFTTVVYYCSILPLLTSVCWPFFNAVYCLLAVVF